MGTEIEAREKVTTMLTQGLGFRVTLDKDQDLMIETAGRDADDISTSLFFQFGEMELKDGNRAYVQISAPMLRNVPESEELYKWIAVKGTGYWFGCVQAFPEENGTVFLRYKYSLLADYLDEAELDNALWMVLLTADRLDDELQKKFGGKRYVDED